LLVIGPEPTSAQLKEFDERTTEIIFANFAILHARSRGASILGEWSMDAKSILLAVTLLMADLSGPATAADNTSGQSGGAAIYSHRGGKTASGEIADPKNLTAAHRSLPFGTMVRVTNTQNGRSIVVRINDRGPFTRGRVIDVTAAAARALGFSGIASVKLSRGP
jgi:rare lipoprotein A